MGSSPDDVVELDVPRGRHARQRAIPRLLAAAVAVAGFGIYVIVAYGFSHTVVGPTAMSTTSTTAVDQTLVDHSPAVAAESPLLPVSGSSTSGRLVISALHVDAQIVPEGVDATPGDSGNLAVPADAAEVGWWDGGPAPGQAGTSVLAGHRAANGAFWTLPTLAVGSKVDVIGTNAAQTEWTVTSVQQIVKDQIPSSIWSQTGHPRLALVTCGGEFLYSIGHYADNVIVWATPA